MALVVGAVCNSGHKDQSVVNCTWDKFISNGNNTWNLVPQRSSEYVRFLCLKNLSSLKGTAMLIGMYGDSIMSAQHSRKWGKEFRMNGQTGFTAMIYNLILSTA